MYRFNNVTFFGPKYNKKQKTEGHLVCSSLQAFRLGLVGDWGSEPSKHSYDSKYDVRHITEVPKS